MTYATRQDLVDRFGTGEVEKLERGGRSVTAAIEDADADIDGRLSTAFALPLPAGRTWPQLTAIAADLARARLYDDKPTGAVSGRADAARTRLGELVDGTRQLLDADGQALERRAEGTTAGGESLFGGNALDGF